MKKVAIAASAVAAAALVGTGLYAMKKRAPVDDDFDITTQKWADPEGSDPLDERIYQLAQEYTDLAVTILKEAIRIPSDHYEQDPFNGTSNHEKERLEYLKKTIVDIGAVLSPDDVFFDEFGQLVWIVTDPDDPMNREDRKVIWFDGHSDTVYPLRKEWQEELGEGIDCYDGLKDASKVSMEQMTKQLRYVPDKSKWDELVFGRGSADQLQGVISQIIATKILLETRQLGSLKGVIVRSVATVAEEDNDGGSPMYALRKTQLRPDEVPDAVIFTEGTGDLSNDKGPCGIYIGQRGRCQIQVKIIGESCHGSMPQQGKNPLEYGSLIIAEAAEVAKHEGFLGNKFLGAGTRTASWCQLETPSDCAVPATYTFRFDRRMTRGETAESSISEIEKLRSVKVAREAGLKVEISIPHYDHPSWKGVKADNPQDYMGWVTPPQDPVVKAAVEAYKRCCTPHIVEPAAPTPDDLRKNPRVERWIFSTDGVGYPIKKGTERFDLSKKNWIEAGEFVHPPMFGIGAGYEHHCHKLGEYLHKDHLWCPISVMARFPSLFVKHREQ